MAKSHFKLCYLIALHTGDVTFTTITLSEEKQKKWIQEMIDEGVLTSNNPGLDVTLKGETLLAEAISLYRTTVL